MSEICQKCGLPQELCICGEIAKESQKINVRVINRRFGKFVTIISGFDSGTDVKALGKIFKRKLACGGTVRENEIELQGKHREKAREILLSEGFKEGLIDV